MFKKVTSILLALMLTAALAACSGGGNTPAAPESAAPSPSISEAEPSAESGKAMAPLVVSAHTGEPNAFHKKAYELFQQKFPDVQVETVVTDTNTREQVMKTAISAGDPPAVGIYWGTRVNTFYDSGMCLDLTGRLEQSEIDKISEAMLQPCIGPNGEVFAIPTDTVYHTVFYNKDMMDKYGFSEPETWAEMTEIFARLKQDDIFGFATNSASMQDCLYGITYAELEAKVGPGTSYGVANGDVSVAPGSPAGEVIRSCIEQVKEWYDAGYWYPGDGGINCTADDANAAFAQERCMFIFNFSGAILKHESSCDFPIGTFLKPTSQTGMTSYENIEPNVSFIPSNATDEQINSAIEFLKCQISLEAQQAIVDANNIPSVLSYSYTNMSPILTEILGNLNTGSLIAGLNPTRTSSEMQTFVKQQVFAAPCGGTMTIDETLNEMERIRLAAKK